VTDAGECRADDAGLPEITEEGDNPGWRIRVGGSRSLIEALAEADEQGIWFDTEKELDAYVQGFIDRRTGPTRPARG
jgi:hypothetical protein